MCMGFPGSSAVKNPPAVQELQKAQVPSLGWKIPWRRMWQPTPVFLLKNPMDKGAWEATVRSAAKSWTRLK